LPDSIWVPLRKYKLIRTPQEQQYHLLHNAAIAIVKVTAYSIGVKRGLSAALALDVRTRDLKLVFKTGYTADLDLLLDKSDLLIHEKWLDFGASHDGADCWLSSLASASGIKIDTFSCDHIVTNLYGLVLNELDSRDGGLAADEKSLNLKVSERLREMPRKIEIAPGQEAGEIEVSWVDAASDMASRLHGLNVKGRITLHRERTCSEKKFELLTSERE
jgi:hypothetical protein